LLKILNSINDRHRQQSEGLHVENMDNMEDEWEYLESQIFDTHRVDPCALYQYIFEQWQIELTSLLKEFSSLFFYESVKDSVDYKMQSLFDKCDQ